jgi:hypothetical protein
MSDAFFRASGIDANDGAKVVFVWCRSEAQGSPLLVGSGHIVSAGVSLPPGIRLGQFSVTFLLPPGYSADNVVVTDDTDGKIFLPDVTVTDCSTSVGAHLGVAAPHSDPRARANGANGSRQPSLNDDGARQEMGS